MKIDKESLQKSYSEMKTEDLFVLLWKKEELSELAFVVLTEEFHSRNITEDRQAEIIKILENYKLRAVKNWAKVIVNYTITERTSKISLIIQKYSDAVSKNRVLAESIEAWLKKTSNAEYNRQGKNIKNVDKKIALTIKEKNALINKLNDDLDELNDKMYELYCAYENDKRLTGNVDKIDRIFVGLCKEYESWKSFALALEAASSRLEQQLKNINKYHVKIQPLIKEGFNILSKAKNRIHDEVKNNDDKVSGEDLRQRYNKMEIEDLIELRCKGGLLDLASGVLEEVLKSRGVSDDKLAELAKEFELAELTQELEGKVRSSEKKKFYGKPISWYLKVSLVIFVLLYIFL